MSHPVAPPSGSTPSKTPLRVAVVEPHAEMLRLILGQLEEHRTLEVKVLKDAAAFFEVYDSSAPPHVLLVGLDSDPLEALGIAKRLNSLAPTCGILVYGKAATMELLSQAMAVGARRYLPFPFDDTTVYNAILDIYEEMRPLAVTMRPTLPTGTVPAPTPIEAPRDPKVVAVFSPKGGVGTSTLAVNLACALTRLNRRVVIVDGNISFGNVGVFLNLSPQRTMLQLVGDPNGIHDTNVEEVLLRHRSGLKALLSPINPEEGDAIQGDHMRHIITALRVRYDYVIIDTWPSYDERVLAMLEVADQILVPTGPELPSIKNLASFLRVATLLEFPTEKLVPILMRSNSVSPDHLLDLESFLKRPLAWRIVSDGRLVTQSLNNGEPFILTDPSAAVSQNIFALARMLDGMEESDTDTVETRPLPFWKRSFFRQRRAS